MGNLFSGMSPDMQIDVDFFNGNPTTISLELLQNSKTIIAELEHYRGCGEKIRDALSKSTDDQLQRDAFNAVCPNIEVISHFHTFGSELGIKTGELAAQLTSVEACQTHLPEVIALGELILFCHQFDQMKMLKPEIQNDFSYYRRSLGSKALSTTFASVSHPPVSSDMANVISMWLAQNLPMTLSINGRQTRPGAVAHIANICCGMILRNRCTRDGELRKVTTMMVAATVLYDRIATEAGGAFSSNSLLRIRKVIKALSLYEGGDRAVLCNSLKYSSAHLNDASTPESLRTEIMGL